MGKHLHLFRRGHVYYWRRRIPGFSTGNAMLQLSLRSETRGEAYIRARKLTAESDRMSDALSRNLRSVDDARKWLSHVITEELARMRRADLVTRMDPVGTVDEDDLAGGGHASRAAHVGCAHGPGWYLGKTRSPSCP